MHGPNGGLISKVLLYIIKFLQFVPLIIATIQSRIVDRVNILSQGFPKLQYNLYLIMYKIILELHGEGVQAIILPFGLPLKIIFMSSSFHNVST